MARIRVLGELVANQIAAGEVVERPASVVKELVENALDAGSTRVAVTLEAGGKSLIRVEDDGSGIVPEDVPLAFERHATSKLETVADLRRIATLGFRGEALPSIAAVSRLRLTSLAEGRQGTRIEIAGGKVESLEPVAFARGTTVEVRDLFFNVPARLKFLRSTAAETAASVSLLGKLGLVHHAIQLVLTVNGAPRLECPAASTLRERAGQLFGPARAEHFLDLGPFEAGGMQVTGLLEPPDRHHPTRSEQYLIVNRRPVADRTLQHAVRQAYEGLLPARRFPSVLLFLAVPPGAVDVNVHPAKTEVRFADERSVHCVVVKALGEALSRARFVPEARLEPRAEDRVREAVEDFLGRTRREAPVVRRYRLDPERPAQVERPERAAAAAPRPAPEPVLEPAGPRVIGQYRGTFIVAADAEGLLLADQHTAHERVLYEELAGRPAGPPATQRLLLPEEVELPPLKVGVLLEHRQSLADLGIELEPEGENRFRVTALPAALEAGRAGRLLLDCLEGLGTGEPEVGFEALRHHWLATIACHAAVKRNMPLDTGKLQWILEALLRTADPYRCPHGRAALLRLEDDAIRKSFGRYW